MIARPSDQRIASSAVHSDFEVGLESGKIIGRALIRAIARTTVSLKACATVETPMIAVGRTTSTTSDNRVSGESSPDGAPTGNFSPDTSCAYRCK